MGSFGSSRNMTLTVPTLEELKSLNSLRQQMVPMCCGSDSAAGESPFRGDC